MPCTCEDGIDAATFICPRLDRLLDGEIAPSSCASGPDLVRHALRGGEAGEANGEVPSSASWLRELLRTRPPLRCPTGDRGVAKPLGVPSGGERREAFATPLFSVESFPTTSLLCDRCCSEPSSGDLSKGLSPCP